MEEMLAEEVADLLEETEQERTRNSSSSSRRKGQGRHPPPFSQGHGHGGHGYSQARPGGKRPLTNEEEYELMGMCPSFLFFILFISFTSPPLFLSLSLFLCYSMFFM